MGKPPPRAHIRFLQFEWQPAVPLQLEMYDCLARFETPDADGHLIEGVAKWFRIDPSMVDNLLPLLALPSPVVLGYTELTRAADRYMRYLFVDHGLAMGEQRVEEGRHFIALAWAESFELENQQWRSVWRGRPGPTGVGT